MSRKEEPTTSAIEKSEQPKPDKPLQETQPSQETKTVHEWAVLRGHVEPPTRRPPSEHKGWILNATIQHLELGLSKPIDKKFTADEYDAAVKEMLNIPMGGTPNGGEK